MNKYYLKDKTKDGIRYILNLMDRNIIGIVNHNLDKLNHSEMQMKDMLKCSFIHN